jgi:hypothetical protein
VQSASVGFHGTTDDENLLTDNALHRISITPSANSCNIRDGRSELYSIQLKVNQMEFMETNLCVRRDLDG